MISFPLLRGLVEHLQAEFLGQALHVSVPEEFVDAFGTHLGDELSRIVEGEAVVLRKPCHDVEVLVLREQIHLLKTAVTRIHHDVLLVVDDGFELLGRKSQKGGDLVRSRLEVPDVSHRNCQGDVSHPFPADFLLCHLDTASVADDSAVTDPLVLSAIAFVVFCRSEYLFAEETVPLRLVGPVVDCLRLQDLAAGPRRDVLWRGQRDADLREVALYLVFLIIESRHILECQYS